MSTQLRNGPRDGRWLEQEIPIGHLVHVVELDLRPDGYYTVQHAYRKTSPFFALYVGVENETWGPIPDYYAPRLGPEPYVEPHVCDCDYCGYDL